MNTRDVVGEGKGPFCVVLALFVESSKLQNNAAFIPRKNKLLSRLLTSALFSSLPRLMSF
jgi:hypothetical protein